MKFKLILFLLLISARILCASEDTTRAELISLMKERNLLFEKYSESISKKSGFFGNRTKNDLKDSHDRLAEIVRVDNKMMSSLNRALSYRNFEKINMRMDVSDFENRISNLRKVNESLLSNNKILEEKNRSNSLALKKHRVYFAMLILLVILSTGAWLRRIFRD